MDTPESSSIGMSLRTIGNKIPEYNGNRKGLKHWLLQCDLFFHNNDHIEAGDKAVFVTSYLKGDAFSSIAPQLEIYMGDDEDEANKALFENWNLFKRHLQRLFGDTTQRTMAERNIQELRQTSSVADYTNKFQQYATIIDWDDTALQRMFRQGLKPQVKEDLARTGAAIEDLDDLVKEAMRIDTMLFELELEKQNIRRSYHPTQGKKRRHFANSSKNRTPAGHYTSNKPEPMHLDNISKGQDWKVISGTSGGDRQAKRYPKKGNQGEKGSCFNCGKPGHFARDCKKNKVYRQVNMIGTTGWTDEELGWDIIPELDLNRVDMTGQGHDMSNQASQQEDVTSWDDDEDIKRYLAAPYILAGHDGNMNPQHNHQRMGWGDNTHDWVASQNDAPHPGRRITEWEDTSAREFFGEQDFSKMYEELEKEEIRSKTMEDPPRARSYGRTRFSCNNCTRQKIKCRPGDQPDRCSNCVKRGIECVGLVPEQLEIYRHQRINDLMGKTMILDPTPPEERRKTYKIATKRYDMDYRNPRHGELHWSFCVHDECTIHYSAKEGGGYFPRAGSKCKWQWYDCTRDECASHLFDKRGRNYFPGHTEEQCAGRNLVMNKKCTNNTWQVCMNEECVRHDGRKKEHGFDTRSFLGNTKQFPIPSIPEEQYDAMRLNGDTDPYEYE